jgi:hypothetical protein
MKAAYDAGVNFFDCAEGYAAGESERVMGQAIKKFGWKRNDLVISTKINWGGSFGDNPVNNGGLSRKHLIEGLNMSLERLGLDYGIPPRLFFVSKLMGSFKSTSSMRIDRTETRRSKRPCVHSIT